MCIELKQNKSVASGCEVVCVEEEEEDDTGSEWVREKNIFVKAGCSFGFFFLLFVGNGRRKNLFSIASSVGLPTHVVLQCRLFLLFMSLWPLSLPSWHLFQPFFLFFFFFSFCHALLYVSHIPIRRLIDWPLLSVFFVADQIEINSNQVFYHGGTVFLESTERFGKSKVYFFNCFSFVFWR